MEAGGVGPFATTAHRCNRSEWWLRDILSADEVRRGVASARGGGGRSAGGGGRPVTSGGGEPPDRTPEVIALLRAHAVPAPDAPRIARAGGLLRRRTEQEGVEFAALFDLGHGSAVGAPLPGKETEIDLTPQMRLVRPGHRYLHLHTHPASSSFSDRDLRLLLGHPELRTVAVVGQDRTWYLLTKRRGQPMVSVEEGLARWRRQFRDVAQPDNALIAQGLLSEAEALVRELHETMVRLAPEIGLRYDRLEPLR
jgi:hypothetical protein